MVKGLKGFQKGNQLGKLCKGRAPWNKNKKDVYSEETKFNMGKARRGITVLIETKKRISDSWDYNKHLNSINPSKETRLKMRISAIEYIKANKGACCPRIGKHEKIILDELQNIIGFSIKRQFFINGQFLDGYCQELNLAIEVDEKHHYKNNILNQKDIEKQNDVIKSLNCSFLRIKVSDIIIQNKINKNALLIAMRTH